MENVIIGLGNAGTQIVRLAAQQRAFIGDTFYSIDSVTSGINMDNVGTVKNIPILVSEEKCGSGRNRKKGRAMYEYQKSEGMFDDSQTPSISVSISSSVSPVL